MFVVKEALQALRTSLVQTRQNPTNTIAGFIKRQGPGSNKGFALGMVRQLSTYATCHTGEISWQDFSEKLMGEAQQDLSGFSSEQLKRIVDARLGFTQRHIPQMPDKLDFQWTEKEKNKKINTGLSI